MAILPENIRYKLFDTLSLKTMRYVDAVSSKDAGPLVKEIYDQIAEDFFINGSLTSRSKVPGVLAAIWSLGREAILVDDKIDRTTKEAMAATVSSINECPYCGDMLVSLVYAGDREEEAKQILNNREDDIDDPVLRERLQWVRLVATPGSPLPASVPFTYEQLPEAISTIMEMNDINRFSHIVMDGSPVNAPFGLQGIKQFALGIFGNELRTTHVAPLVPGRSLHLTPAADLPEDMRWASSNSRISKTLAQWAAAVEVEARDVIPACVQALVRDKLQQWNYKPVPMSRSWVKEELDDLDGEARSIAKLALLLAKAAYQVDEKLVKEVMGPDADQERFIRILAWCSFTASRYVGSHIAEVTNQIQHGSSMAA
ncbi:MAG: carboxymuconolactone decarboxylase family protein [Candidatus Thiodiazotropha endolucinida]